METIDLKPVEFSCRAPNANVVFLAGGFNGWNADTPPLARQEDGNWSAVVPLPNGHHEYKFVVDGQWCCEPGCERQYPGCPKCAPNGFGTVNRIVQVNCL